MQIPSYMMYGHYGSADVHILFSIMFPGAQISKHVIVKSSESFYVVFIQSTVLFKLIVPHILD